jgi:surface antigen
MRQVMSTAFRSRSNKLLLAMSIVIGVVAGAASSASAYPAYGTIMVPGSGWMGGKGVNVYSNGTSGGTGTYQCVELAARLYATKGWGTVYAAGNGGAYYIPEGSPSLTFKGNGSGYIPVPGDLIIEHPTAGNAYGHVAVVSSVSGSTIKAVEQNASATGWHDYTLSGSTIAGGYGKVRGTIHSPKNTNTNKLAASAFPPITGDWDGDGKTDIGVRQVSNGTFFLRTGPTWEQSSVTWSSAKG